MNDWHRLLDGLGAGGDELRVLARAAGRAALQPVPATTAGLANVAPLLSQGSQQCLRMVAEGLSAGLKQYGALNLDADGRDWWWEAAQEYRDAAVYLGAEIERQLSLGVDPRIAIRMLDQSLQMLDCALTMMRDTNRTVRDVTDHL